MRQPPEQPHHQQQPYKQLPHPLEAQAPTLRVQRVPTSQLSTPAVADAADADEDDGDVPTQRIPRVRLLPKQLSPAVVPEAVQADVAEVRRADSETADADHAGSETADAEHADSETADADHADSENPDPDRADTDPENADTLRMPKLRPAPEQMPPSPISRQEVMTPLPVQKSAKRFGFVALGVTTLAALLVGALLGSSRDGVIATTQPTATVTATATATVSQPASEASEPSTDPGAYDELSVVKFDKYHAYTDGVEVSVTSAKRSIIPPFTAGSIPGDPMVIVTVKIKNGRKKAFNTDIMSVNLAYGSSGRPGEHVVVPGMEGFGGKIDKGRSLSADYAFAVPTKSMNKIVIVINRGLKYSPAIFAGKAS
jgi:hypothetical protein